MNLLQQLVNMVHGSHSVPQAPQHPQPQQQGYTPAQQAQMTPVGQPIPPAMMNSFGPQTRQLAQIYQNNPNDPRVAHLDPAMFGYAPDNGAPSIPMGNPGSFYQLSGDDPVQVQGNDRNPQQGFGPQVQGVGSYPASLQPQRRYNQQQRQIGVPAQPMNNGLVAPIPQIHPQLLQQLSRIR